MWVQDVWSSHANTASALCAWSSSQPDTEDCKVGRLGKDHLRRWEVPRAWWSRMNRLQGLNFGVLRHGKKVA